MSDVGTVGVFDSGLGGLTVVRAMLDALPGIDVVYFGDTARIPYGTKSPDTVRRYAVDIARVLQDAGASTLVVACNTASAVALPHLPDIIGLPTIGVIAPGAEAAVRESRSRRIAVLSTPATRASGAYVRAIQESAPNAVVDQFACPLFVPLVEEGWVEGEVPRLAAERYLADLDPDTDTVVLGCTHYPLLKPLLRECLGPGITLIDSAEATAEAVRRLLAPDGWQEDAASNLRFMVSDAPEAFGQAATAFLGRPLDNVEWHRW